MSVKSPAASWHRPLTIALYLVSFFLVGAILYLAKEVLIPIALAVLLTFMLSPLVTRLDKLGVKRAVSVIIVVLGCGLLLAGLFLFVGMEIRNIIEDVPTYRATIKAKFENLHDINKGGVFDKLTTFFNDLSHELKVEQAKNAGDPKAMPVVEKVTPVRIVEEDGPWRAVSEMVGPYLALAPLVEPLATLGLALILVIFMLIHREDLRNRLVSFGRKGTITNTTRALDDAGQRLSRFLLSQLFINGSFGASVGIGLLILQVPYAFLWGLCAAVLRYIPYIGPWVAAMLPVSVSLITSPGWTQLFLVLGLFLILELISNNVMEPWLYGAGMGVSEVATLVSAAFWGWLWGPVGLILSGPLTVCVVVLGRYMPGLAFLDRLLGDEAPLQASETFLQRLLARDPHEAGVILSEYGKTHGKEEVFDEVVIPALALARREREDGAMSAEDETFIITTARQLLTEQAQQVGSETPHLPRTDDPLPVLIGIPAHHPMEELALMMFDQLMKPLGLPSNLITTKALPSEVIAEVKRDQPLAIFVTAIPPGGLTQAYYLCKQLRKKAPKAIIIVGYLGYQRNLDKLITKLRAAGANYVTTTLQSTRAHLQSLPTREVKPAASPVATVPPSTARKFKNS